MSIPILSKLWSLPLVAGAISFVLLSDSAAASANGEQLETLSENVSPHSERMPPLTPASGAEAPDTLRVAFVGDVLLDRGVRRAIERDGVDALFAPEVDSLFRSCHCVVANLECPATKVRQAIHKRFIFRGEPEWLDALRRHGVTHLNLANNHTMDQGRKGLSDTRQNVVRYGMTPFGMDSTADAACRPLLLSEAPRRVWIFTTLRVMSENWPYLPNRPSVCECTIDTLAARIARLRHREPRAVIIAMLHWGLEHDTLPTRRQRIAARRLVAAGADCLVGHHTHTAQPVEWIGGRPVFYGIGNFIFDPTRPLNAAAWLVRMDVTRDTVRYRLHPVHIDGCTPRLR